jgi:heme A synthase
MTTATWIIGRRMGLSPRAKMALHTVLLVGWAQAVLGISTLVSKNGKIEFNKLIFKLYNAQISLASIHQNGALLLASAIIWLANELRRIPK